MPKYQIFTQDDQKIIVRAENKLSAQKKAITKGVKIAYIQEIQGARLLKKHLKPQNLAFLYKEIALLLGAGVSLQQAISEIAENSDDKTILGFLNGVIKALQSGAKLSQALQNSDFAFAKSELALIKMGEKTGDLAMIFTKLCDLKEKNLANAKALKKALAYPIFVLISLVVAFCALMLFVVPQFKGIFDEFDIALPLITRAMLGIYAFLSQNLAAICVFLALCVILLIALYRNSHAFSYFLDSLMLKIPLISKAIFYHQSAEFFLVFSLLLKSGISTDEALNIAKSSFANKFLQKKCTKIIEFCKQGLTLDSAFKKAKMFESLVLGMLGVAMKSAKLDAMSEKISQFYEARANELVARFLGLLEPLMTLLVAVLVLFLALGIFLPMWELNQGVKF